MAKGSQSHVALVRFLDDVRRTLTRLQLAHPARWRVRGVSDEEVRDTLLLRILEAATDEPSIIERSDVAFALIRTELATLRRRFRLHVTTLDFNEVAVVERAPSQEEQLGELEHERALSEAAERAEATLSRPQRKWLSAMKLAARGGGFFASSQELNLAAASRACGQHRSSAQRALGSLKAHFSRELERAK